MPNDLCSTDKAVPANNSLESVWPTYLRDFKEQVLNSFILEHLCSGRHLFGVDTIGTGANMQVDVGGAPTITGVGVYAGFLVKVKPIHDSISGGTLTVKSGATTIAAGPIKINGADPIAGVIKSGQWIEVVWDGTNWQVISGLSITSYVTNIINTVFASVNYCAVLYQQTESGTIFASDTTEENLDSHIVSGGAIGTWTGYTAQWTVIMENTTASAHLVTFRVYNPATLTPTLLHTFPVFTIPSDTEISLPLSWALGFAGHAGLSLSGQLGISSPSYSMHLGSSIFFGTQ